MMPPPPSTGLRGMRLPWWWRRQGRLKRRRPLSSALPPVRPPRPTRRPPPRRPRPGGRPRPRQRRRRRCPGTCQRGASRRQRRRRAEKGKRRMSFLFGAAWRSSCPANQQRGAVLYTTTAVGLLPSQRPGESQHSAPSPIPTHHCRPWHSPRPRRTDVGPRHKAGGAPPHAGHVARGHGQRVEVNARRPRQCGGRFGRHGWARVRAQRITGCLAACAAGAQHTRPSRRSGEFRLPE